jgi:hypothetical protein
MPDSRLRITLDCDCLQAALALHIARDFVTNHLANHRATRPERHGVLVIYCGVQFYAYGDARHVRVRQESPDA